MSAVPLDTIFGEMGAEKENANNTKPRSSTKKVPATLPEVQIEHRLTREMVKEMITEAIKGLKAEITPKMGDIAQSVVRIADALEEAKARGCFERMSLDEKEGPVIGIEGQKEESEAPGSEVKNGEGQGAIERDPTQGAKKLSINQMSLIAMPADKNSIAEVTEEGHTKIGAEAAVFISMAALSEDTRRRRRLKHAIFTTSAEIPIVSDHPLPRLPVVVCNAPIIQDITASVRIAVDVTLCKGKGSVGSVCSSFSLSFHLLVLSYLFKTIPHNNSSFLV
ncbi:hypothetical protein niasHT_027904 [Heterodera trifolii]|uniref:Uncharacterized protein n=1 Tax=Heterodera trifolii TaxID=157864 RepID=A0ABD2JDR0_9BILA